MMFREKSISKLYAFALAAVFALTLAGCGGGGGTAEMEEEMPMPMPDPQAECMDAGGRYNADGSCTSAADLAEEGALSDAQDAAMAAYMAARAAVYAAVDPVAAANAHKYAAMAGEANTAAQAATTSADAMGHQMAAETARDSAVMAAGMRGLGITGLANMITNQAIIDNDVLEGKTGDDVTDPDSHAGRVGTAMATVAAAAATIGDTPAVTDGPELVTNGRVSQGGTASARATYGASGPTMTVDGAGTTLGRGETPMLLTMRGGWMGRELVEEAADSTTYANAYTDIQADTPGKPVPGAERNDNAALNDLITADNNPVITGDPGDGSTFSGTLNSDPDDNNPPQAGVFTCPADTACAIATNDDGGVVNVAGYTFNAPSTMTGDSTPDDDYLAWGVWLTVPDATTTAPTLGAFASGNMPFTVKAELKGTATYNGVATGLYSAAGMVEYFDADASLMANFGGTVAAGDANDLLGAVTGTVSNIKAGGMDVEGSISLKRATITTTSPAGGFNGETSGSLAGRAVEGMWGGQFYGPSDETGAAAQTQYPTTAAGTFGAFAPGVGSDTVRILGAFGTWKAE